MKVLADIKDVFFVGIGGIGMSALAQFFLMTGRRVYGFDQTKTKLTLKLEAEGARIGYVDHLDALPPTFENTSKSLVVYTPAIPEDSVLLNYFKAQGFRLYKRAEVLGIISAEVPTLAIAGTHGKTTTSAILAHLLHESDYRITAFLGGIAENFDSNFVGEGEDACVVEADEYDRSFLQLQPLFAGITSIEPDHMDIYRDSADLQEAFKDFVDKLPDMTHLFHAEELELSGYSVGFSEEADYSIQNVKISDGRYYFDFETPELKILGLEFKMPGRYNLRNAGLALALALAYGAEPQALKRALPTFKGVDRRFSYRLKLENLILIEDYAHHPNEIKAVYQAVRELYPDQKISVVFQPHLYSRTRDFAEEFGESLSYFDQVFLVPIYPAREKPIPGIDSKYLLSLVKAPFKQLVEKEDLGESLKKAEARIILVLGAGDIGKEVEPLKKALA